MDKERRVRERVVTIDTAVVGGGITGLYVCRKLRELRGPNHAVALFEASERFGGRIETVEMDGFPAEYGPMRFERRAQPLLMKLIDELGLETSPFAPYMATQSPDSLFDLDRDERGQPQSAPGTRLLTALELLSLGILRILGQSPGNPGDPGDPRHWRWWSGLDEAYYHHLRTEATFQGRPLHQTGFWNALGEVLSHNAVNTIIEHGSFYHCVHFNPNAAEWIIFWLRGLHPHDAMVTVKQGVETLVTRAVDALIALEPSVPLHLGHRLISLRQETPDRVRLDLRATNGETVRVVARHVVLALPQSPLRALRQCLPGHIGAHVDAVIPIPLLKIFYVTETPWWDAKTPPQTRASSMPTRELHYYIRGEGRDRRGMVMVYGDPPSMHYWKPFILREPHEKAELNGDRQLLHYYLKYLGVDPTTADPAQRQAKRDAVTCFGIRDWSREPFAAGCHIWKPGVQAEKAIRELTAFSLSGNLDAPQNVHICGEAYSDFQGFIEGGLRTGLTVVEGIG